MVHRNITTEDIFKCMPTNLLKIWQDNYIGGKSLRSLRDTAKIAEKELAWIEKARNYGPVFLFIIMVTPLFTYLAFAKEPRNSVAPIILLILGVVEVIATGYFISKSTAKIERHDNEIKEFKYAIAELLETLNSLGVETVLELESMSSATFKLRLIILRKDILKSEAELETARFDRKIDFNRVREIDDSLITKCNQYKNMEVHLSRFCIVFDAKGICEMAKNELK